MTRTHQIDNAQTFVAGFGFRQSATIHSFEALLKLIDLADIITQIAVLADKAHHPEFRRFCTKNGFQPIMIDQHQIAAMHTPSQTHASRFYRDTGSVCEAVALCAGGIDSVIIRPKIISDDRLASCAISSSIDIVL